ncbi:DUF5818 domain-containing protein [Micromonospora endolithica]|uniref:DUF5818 domain-containing protein n=1 Tax=Micromonospora endolithica TaxID=230091 RepID=UPI0011ADEC7B|nr:DUF5818 domain-containing protein [Micromonospora endolithica]TWJ22165.1 hypothetical protein JD76_02279 [Micromonospora endolithica]
MRRVPLLLAAIGLLCWLTACSSAPQRSESSPGTSPPPSGSGPVVPPSAGSTGSPPVSVPPPPAASTVPPEATGGPPGAPPTTAGEVPGPLPFGNRTLTGTVERAGECTVLVVGARRWALTGDPVAALRPGSRVTVRGAVTPMPASCTDPELTQAVAVNRVEPA